MLVLGRLLADISRNLPDRPIDVATDGNKVQVTCGSSRFSLLMMPVDDYPTLPSSPEPSGTIDGDVFTQAVAQVSIAADRGDTLPILTGVRVEIEGDTMTLLATDRYRLAMRELTWNPTATDASHVALIPARTLSDTATLARRQRLDRRRARHRRRRRRAGRLRGRSAAHDDPAARRRVPQGHLDLPHQRRDRVGHQDGRPGRGRSSASPWSPSATPRCACSSPTARSPSRPAPATTPRRPRRSRPTLTGPEIEIAFNPHLPARRARRRRHDLQRGLSFTQASPARGAHRSGRGGRRVRRHRYRYVLMPVRFAS